MLAAGGGVGWVGWGHGGVHDMAVSQLLLLVCKRFACPARGTANGVWTSPYTGEVQRIVIDWHRHTYLLTMELYGRPERARCNQAALLLGDWLAPDGPCWWYAVRYDSCYGEEAQHGILPALHSAPQERVEASGRRIIGAGVRLGLQQYAKKKGPFTPPRDSRS